MPSANYCRRGGVRRAGCARGSDATSPDVPRATSRPSAGSLRVERLGSAGLSVRAREEGGVVQAERAELSEGAAIEEDRPAVRVEPDLDDLAEEERVVAAVVGGVQRAVDPGHNVGEDRRAAAARSVGQVPERVNHLAVAPGETPRDLLLLAAQDIDRERSASPDVPAGGGLLAHRD